MGVVTVGVDLGQRRDPTAIAVVETEPRERDERREVHHLARHLERLPLGTSYPDVAARVAEVCARLAERVRDKPTLYVDATGLGQPVVDTIRAAGVQAKLIPVYFTHGDRRTVENGEVRLGKAYLVSRLQALLQSGRLHLPKTANAEALGRELLDYEIRVEEQANDRYGTFRVGSHDYLVTALGLATQVDPVEIPLVAPVGGTKGSFWHSGSEWGPSRWRSVK